LWWQDLVISAAKSLDAVNPLAARALAGAQVTERVAVRAADRIVSCSPGFVDYLVSIGARPEQIATVLNWVDTDWIRPVEPERSSVTRVLYSGNLGYTQGFETAIEALELLPAEIELRLVGEGNAADRVRGLAGRDARIQIRPPVRRSDFPGLLAAADILLVLQRRVGAGVNFPSKIGPYLASGRPVVASMDPATPAAAFLRESGGALVVPPEDPAALAQALARLHGDVELRAELGRRGRAHAVRHLDRTAALSMLEQEFLRG
jgi:colanic acid biosynthesis glycosyl transferase WcaI